MPCYFDAEDVAAHRRFYEVLQPPPEGVFWSCGYLGDQVRAQMDFSEARLILEINLLGAVGILEIVAADLARRR